MAFKRTKSLCHSCPDPKGQSCSVLRFFFLLLCRVVLCQLPSFCPRCAGVSYVKYSLRPRFSFRSICLVTNVTSLMLLSHLNYLWVFISLKNNSWGQGVAQWYHWAWVYEISTCIPLYSFVGVLKRKQKYADRFITSSLGLKFYLVFPSSGWKESVLTYRKHFKLLVFWYQL